jgi:hypothetical protein
MEAAEQVAGLGAQDAMLQVFTPSNFADIARYLYQAHKRRFSAGGIALMMNVAAGYRPVDASETSSGIDDASGEVSCSV